VRAEGQAFVRAQGFDLGEREVLGEPPLIDWPSIVFVVLRSANSSPTSVVPPISFSWRAMRTPSFVETRSGSTKSAPISAARPVRRQRVLGPMPAGAAWPMIDRA
jgi:hypothetical protein